MFEDKFASLLNHAAASNGHCVGAMLFTEGGEVVDVSTLLRVEDYKVDSLGVWARLTCVSRIQLTDVRRSADGYSWARVRLYTDDLTATLSTSITAVRAVHSSVAEARRQLLELLSVEPFDDMLEAETHECIHVGEDKRTAPFGLFADVEGDGMELEDEEYVFVGEEWERPRGVGTCFFHCRDPGELDDEESGRELDQLVATRRAALVSGEGLATAVGDAWGVTSEAEAEMQLLSFAAAATLSPLERFEALLITDAAQRLSFALEALRDQRRNLQEMQLALQAGGDW